MPGIWGLTTGITDQAQEQESDSAFCGCLHFWKLPFGGFVEEAVMRRVYDMMTSSANSENEDCWVLQKTIIHMVATVPKDGGKINEGTCITYNLNHNLGTRIAAI